MHMDPSNYFVVVNTYCLECFLLLISTDHEFTTPLALSCNGPQALRQIKIWLSLSLSLHVLTLTAWCESQSVSIYYQVLLWLALPWKKTNPDTWQTFPAYNKLHTVPLIGWSVVLYMSSYSVPFQSVVLITKLLFIVFCVISVWYWSPCCCLFPSWLYSVWFQSMVLITMPPFIALMIVFCMISICGMITKLLSLHDCIL